MTDVSLTIAFILIAVVICLISNFVHNLSKEIDELKEKLVRHQKLCDWYDHEQRLSKIEDEIDLIMWYDGEAKNEDEKK